jgi:tetratricopeptide (TPR) repeat protein
VHPVQVESVAWISEQKNTLSLAFALGALLAYLKFDQGRRASTYALATALFVLGLLSKTVAAVLPGAILVVLWWRDGRLSRRRHLAPLLPWLGAGIAAGLLTAWFERTLLGGATGSGLQIAERVLLAARVPSFYLQKLLWPAGLAFVYPRWDLDASSWRQWLFVPATLAVVACAWLLRRRTRAPLAVVLLFLGALFPALGFVDVFPFTFSYVADHFQYMASLAILAPAGVAIALSITRLPSHRRRAAHALCAVLVGTLGVLTWRQCREYRSTQTLFEATLLRNPQCWMCLVNLGNIAMNAGDAAGAIERLRRALAINPNVAEAQNDLGNALINAGSTAEAAVHFREAVRLSPNYVVARSNLGGALAMLGQVAEAREQFQAALRIMPDYEPARENLRRLDAGPAAPAPSR